LANFGERIAYWYLRLQGFLLVEDFVLHAGAQIDRTADADLLAVRHMYSEEEISGQILSPDKCLQTQLAAHQRNVGLVVQVKTGTESRAGRAFEHSRLVYALRFLGIAPPDHAHTLAAALADKPLVEWAPDWTIAKLLIAESPANDEFALTVPLDDALAFIRDRLALHRVRKAADRLSFHDELMQFLAWSASNSDIRGR
jgi:hypothetical protein